MPSSSLAAAYERPPTPERTRRYETAAADSLRWDAYRPRDGDIIVTTAPKCGTTWTQMLCALLVHGPHLPAPLTRLSPEFDRPWTPVEALMGELDAQPWRRVIKTHTPIDGLPYFENVTYVHCGRDPRDAFLSMMDHMQNASEAFKAAVRQRAGLPPESWFPADPNTCFPVWMTTPIHAWMEDGFPTGSVFHASRAAWPHRGLDNLHFLHYRDLRLDLEGEMRRLAEGLGIRVSRADWPALLEAASFGAMKAHADETAPGAHLGDWASNAAFFASGRLNAWRNVLNEANQALYQQLAPQRVDLELQAWLEGGRAAMDPLAE
jgi:aryl sulfotransferase